MEGKTSYVTSAVGMEETAGRLRARRSSLFMQTVVWVTGLVCLAFLLGTLVQTVSNHQLAQALQSAQQQTQQLSDQHDRLAQQAKHYQDPYVIESESRQQLGYARPGEHVIVTIGVSSPTQSANAAGVPHEATTNFWQAWWQLLFGNG